MTFHKILQPRIFLESETYLMTNKTAMGKIIAFNSHKSSVIVSVWSRYVLYEISFS